MFFGAATVQIVLLDHTTRSTPSNRLEGSGRGRIKNIIFIFMDVLRKITEIFQDSSSRSQNFKLEIFKYEADFLPLARHVRKLQCYHHHHHCYNQEQQL
jgi:hypothetical protein